jgi:hypothetical protein
LSAGASSIPQLAVEHNSARLQAPVPDHSLAHHVDIVELAILEFEDRSLADAAGPNAANSPSPIVRRSTAILLKRVHGGDTRVQIPRANCLASIVWSVKFGVSFLSY